MSAAAIAIRGLLTRFGATVIHQDLDLEVRRGEVLGVVGGSGTGKSVLLRTIVGLNRRAAGEIRVFGDDPSELSPAARSKLEQRWGVLFQDGALFSSLTVAQNVMAPMREHVRPPLDLMEDMASLKIAMAGLPPDAGSKYPAELSGGMRKRAALARALALDPDLLFLDEPTAGLDPIGASEFDRLIADLKKALGLTVFMVTHDLDSLHAICDRVAVLAEKRVIAVGPIDEIAKTDHAWIRKYFDGPRGRMAARAAG